jgi:hypothetical protein
LARLGRIGSDWSSGGRRSRRYIPTVEVLDDRTMPSIVPIGLDFALNNQIFSDQFTSATLRPSVAQASNGNLLAVWTSDTQDGDDLGVYGRLFNSAGVALGNEFRITNSTADDQFDPAVAADSQGRFVVTWSIDTSGNRDIYARRFDASGIALGSEFKANSTAGDDENQSAVAFDDAGNFIVAWTRKNSGDTDIFARRFNASGAPLGADFRVNTLATRDNETPSIAFNSQSQTFLIAWAADQGGGWDILGQRLDALGAKVGGQFLVNQTTGQDQTNPTVLADAGAFSVAWTGQSSNRNVFNRWFDASSGAALGNEAVLNATTAGDQRDVSIVVVGGGEYLAVWSSNQTGSFDIYGQKIDAASQRLGGEFLINTATLGSQIQPFVGGGNGAALVIWSGNQNLTWDVFSRAFRQGDIVVSAAPLSTSEAGGSATFTVVLANQPTADVTIGIRSSNLFEGIVSVPALTFTTADWNIPQTVTVIGINDFAVDGDIGFAILTDPAISADPAYNLQDAADVTVLNRDNDAAGFIVTPITGPTSEAGGQATFTVALASQPTADVNFLVVSSNAAEGQTDVTSLTFTSANWNTFQTVTVTGLDDLADDGDVFYNIVLWPAVSTDAVYNAFKPNNVTVVNLDNDTAGIRISPISGATTEAGGSATFTVVLDSRPIADVTVALASSDPSEGTIAIGSLTFTTANWNVAQTVTVQGVDDGASDGDRAYFIVTGPAVSADPFYNGLNPADVAVTNLDDEPVSGVVLGTVSGPTTEAGGTATFTIALSRAPILGTVQIAVVSGDTSEGTVATPVLTFGGGNWSVPQTVTIVGVDDAIADGDRAFSADLSVAFALDPFFLLLTPIPSVPVINQDDDVAGILVSPVSGPVSETGTTATFSVVLASRPLANVVVPVRSGDLSEGTVSTGALTFTPGNWNVAQTVTVQGVDDLIVDGDVGFAVILDPAVTADSTYQGINSQSIAVINRDDDVAGILVSALSGPTTEAGGAAFFTISLASQPTAAVTIGLTIDRPSEGVLFVGSVTFTPLNWNTPQAVFVQGQDDFVADGDQRFNVITALATSADLAYQGRSAANVVGFNLDDDVAGFVIGPISGSTTEAGGTASFTVVLTSQPTGVVLIPVTSSNPAEGAVSAAPLIFDAANWNIPQTVVVSGVDDSIVDGAQTYLVNLGPATSTDVSFQGQSAGSVVVVNQDDDVPGILITAVSGPTTEAGGFATFKIVLQSQPIDDVTITMRSSDTAEGALLVGQVTFTALDWNVAQTVIIQGVDDPRIDGDQAYAIQFSVASTDPQYAASALTPVSVVNQDDDLPRGPAPTGNTPPITPVVPPIVVVIVAPPPSNTKPDGTPAITPAQDTPAVNPDDDVVGKPVNNDAVDKDLPKFVAISTVGIAPPTIAAAAPPPAIALAAPPAAPEPAQAPPAAQAAPANAPAPAPAVVAPIPAPVLPLAASLAELRAQIQAQIQAQTSHFNSVADTAARHASTEKRIVNAALTISAAVTAGYALLASQLLSWAIAFLTAQPLWRRFDPLEILFAWDEEKRRRRKNDKERLTSLVKRE